MKKKRISETKKKLRKLGFTGKLDEKYSLWFEYGFNKVCESCIHKCKQHGSSKIINCPSFANKYKQ